MPLDPDDQGGSACLQIIPSVYLPPALEQALEIPSFLKKHDAGISQAKGGFFIYTSGNPQIYIDVAKRLELHDPDAVIV